MGLWFFLCISAIGGIACLQQLPALPSFSHLLLLQSMCFVILLFLYKSHQLSARKKWIFIFSCFFVFLIALSYGTWRAQLRLADGLDLQHDDRVSRLVVEVSDLVDYGDNYLQFDARVISSKPSVGIPTRVRIRWSFGAFVGPYQQAPPLKEPMPEIKPG